MPELPEAETIARTLTTALGGAQVAQVMLRRRDMLKSGTPSGLRRLAGSQLGEVRRRGKYLVMDFDRLRLVLQLGMAGRPCLDWTGRPLPAHTHLVLTFADGLQLRYVNARRIAAGVHLLESGQEGPLGSLGPDADAIGCIEFLQRLNGRRAPIKAALLNQSILAGVGNIYSDEALFRAGIRPTRRVHHIARAELKRLHGALRSVLAEAVAAGGSTVTASNPFANADGELGRFALAHRVYGRYGQPCLKCGRKLLRTAVGGRTSTYCPRCQK